MAASNTRKTSALLLIIALGALAVAVVAGVVFAMTRTPKLNEDVEDAGARHAEPIATATGSFNTSDDGVHDPHGGRFTLEDARRAVPGAGGFSATLRTSKGDLRCNLYENRAPNTVANFVGLATGARAWKDPKTQLWTRRPAYDGTVFHRVIKDFMIQGGDPLGTGTGEPGYTIPDEMWGERHDRAGQLCMANRGPDTNGAQFFITDAPAPHIDNSYTIFGDCTPLEVVHAIANEPTDRDRPLQPVVITSVQIHRGG